MSPAKIIETTKEKAIETKDEVVGKALEKAELVKKSSVFKTLWRVNRNFTLASLGAIALLGDQINDIGERCIERGEDVEKNAKQFARGRIQNIKKIVTWRKKPEVTEEVKEETAEAEIDAEVKEAVTTEA